MKITIHTYLAAGLLVASAGADTFPGFTIEFNSIGAAGNVADVTGFGAVTYDYRIGTTEVTIDQFVKSGVGSGNEDAWVGIGSNAPATQVSWHEAARYSNWLTTGDENSGAYLIGGGGLVTGIDRASAVSTYGTVYVLPTVDEFYKAAYFDASGGGSGYSTYADGTNIRPTEGIDVNYDDGGSPLGVPWLVGTGITEQNGTRDMMGNVWEWLESLPADNDPLERAVSGGSYLSDSVSLRNIGSRPGVSLATSSTQIGFRVVAIPEPGTLSLMSLSTISLFFTRAARRRKLAGRSLLPVRHEHFCDAYCAVDEWEASFEEEESAPVGYLQTVVLPSLQLAWNKVDARYQAMHRVFWNHMVVVHESRTVARKVFKITFKQKALAYFDGFLALFMK